MSSASEICPERWVLIQGGPYEISDLGRVRNTATGLILAPGFTHGGNGYALVTLCMKKRRTTCYIHRTVCETFNGEKPDWAQVVAHVDGNRKNNRADNLRWSTNVENEADKRRHGTVARGARNGFSKLTEDDVRRIRELRAAGVSLKGVAAMFGINWVHVCDIANRRRWKHVA